MPSPDVRSAVPPFTRADLERTIADRFETVARAQPDRPALSAGHRRWTYAALNEEANRLAHAIRAAVPDPPQRIAYLSVHSPEMVTTALAILKAGHAYLALHPRTPSAEHARFIRQQSPALILAGPQLADAVQEIADGRAPVLATESIAAVPSGGDPQRSTTPHDPAGVFHTSGTTGEPTVVIRSHRMVLHRVWLEAQQDALLPTDRQSLLTHAAFGAAQFDMLGTLLLGAELCLFDVTTEGLAAFRDWIAAERVSHLHPPIQLFRRFLASLPDDAQFPSVRAVKIGGDRIIASDVERWKRHFPRPGVLVHRFSTTETAVLTINRIDHDTVLDETTIAAGHPVADKALRIVDAEGRAIASGEVGFVEVTSDVIAAERPLRTGDLARFLPDGRLQFVGRRDHRVKVRGYRVDLQEIEAGLLGLKGVAEAAVVVDPTNDDETQLIAFVAPVSGAALHPYALRTALAADLAEWKLPAHFRVLPSLPSTLTGKIDRQALLNRARMPVANAAGIVTAPPADELERQIAERWQAILRGPAVNRSDDFFLAGGDSLNAIVLHLHLERATRLVIPIAALFEDPTLAGMAGVIRQLQAMDPAARPAAASVLVPLKTSGTLTPLFLVHGRPGRAFAKPHVLRILGPEQPVYTFQASGLDLAREPIPSVEEMARQYVEAMRSVQAEGPYFLGSVCAGGLVAVAMANQLAAVGQHVAPLMLIDPPARPAGDLPWWRRYRRLVRAYYRRRFVDRARDPARDFEMARLRYRGWRYDGPVLMLRSGERLRKDGRARRGTFSSHLTGDVRWFQVGANHREVQGVENERFAGQLSACAAIARADLARHASKV
jgi:acyl-CoA synthetase (AMP-forming)/AMP-acid ligase II